MDQGESLRAKMLRKSTGTGPGKSRPGCLGFLGFIGGLVLLVPLLMLAATAIFDPWVFYLGGKFHITPYWQGWGKLHAKSGDYLLFVRLQPYTRGRGLALLTTVSGSADICTPRGEQIPLSVLGS